MVIELGDMILGIDQKVIDIFMSFTQDDESKPEAGGILIGYYIDDYSFYISDISTPTQDDRGSRFNFIRLSSIILLLWTSEIHRQINTNMINKLKSNEIRLTFNEIKQFMLDDSFIFNMRYEVLQLLISHLFFYIADYFKASSELLTEKKNK